MADQTPDKQDPKVKKLTAADAAKSVKRPVTTTEVVGKDEHGEPVTRNTTKLVAVLEKEVLDFKDYGTHVVVVTIDGQKFSSAD